MAVGKAAAVPQRQRISLLKDNFVQGGILPEGDYLFTQPKFVLFAYTDKEGKATGATTVAKRVVLIPVTKNDKNQWVQIPENEQAPSDQHWSIGDQKNFAPSADGNFLEAMGTKTTLSKQCKYYFLFESLVNAGVSEQQYDQEGAKLLDGMVAHIKHVDAPDYSEMRKRNAAGGGVGVTGQPQAQPKPDRKETIPVVSVIHVAPWEKGSKSAVKPAAAAAVAPAAPAAAEEAEEGSTGDNSELLALILSEVQTNGGKITATKCRLNCHKALNKKKVDAGTRDEMLKPFDDESVLGDILTEIDCVIKDGEIVAV